MKTERNYEVEILNFLKSNSDDYFSLTDLAEKLDMNIMTVSKYVGILEAKDLVEVDDRKIIKLVRIKCPKR